jgi:hypothetical protein
MKSPVKMLTDLAGRLAGARGALDDLHAADKELRKMHEDLQAERARLCGARPPHAELIAAAEEQVDALAAAWAAANGLQLVVAVGGSIDVQPSREVRGVISGNLLHAPALMGMLDVPTLAALVPAQLKAGLRRLIEATEYAEGPPMSERPRLIAELDEKIADVEREHSQLVDQARGLGIEIALLDDVRYRRAHEAHLAENRARLARDLARSSRR